MFDDEDGPDSGAVAPDSEADPPDPEADLPDPGSELPSVPHVEVPSVEVPEAPEPGGAPSGALQRDFWGAVLVFNVALLATSVGAMLIAFGVDRLLGAGLAAVGLLSWVHGYLLYRRLQGRTG